MAMDLFEASCRLGQVDAVLSTWLKNCGDEHEANLISAILTLLEGVKASVDTEEKNKNTNK